MIKASSTTFAINHYSQPVSTGQYDANPAMAGSMRRPAHGRETGRAGELRAMRAMAGAFFRR
jgi:hypothetical protein